MRVLIVDHHAGSPHQQALYRALATEHGFDLTILVARRWHDGFADVQTSVIPGARVIAAPTLFGGRSHRAFTPRLWRILRKDRYEIAFLNAEPESFQALHALVGRAIFAASTRLVVISWRNIVQLPGVYPYRLGWLHHVAERSVLKRLDGLVAHNVSAREIFRQKTSAAISVIPPCVDIGLFQEGREARRSVESPTEGLAIGFAGRLVPEKGLDVLLRACAGIGTAKAIHILGTGPEEPRLKELAASLGLAGRITWHGAVGQGELPKYLSALDVMVLPSRTTEFWREQFGRILIEAMAAGVPVIGSDSGEIPHTIGPAGMVFPEGDVAALRSMLLRVQSDLELRTQFANAGRRRVEEKFSSRVVAAEYAALFRRICSPK